MLRLPGSDGRSNGLAPEAPRPGLRALVSREAALDDPRHHSIRWLELMRESVA